jgi:hypothetical protein
MGSRTHFGIDECVVARFHPVFLVPLTQSSPGFCFSLGGQFVLINGPLLGAIDTGSQIDTLVVALTGIVYLGVGERCFDDVRCAGCVMGVAQAM